MVSKLRKMQATLSWKSEERPEGMPSPTFIVDACGWSRAAVGPASDRSNNYEMGLTEGKKAASNPNSTFVFFVALCKTSGPFFLKHIFKWPIEICIERITPVGVFRKVAPMFVHPEPGRWILSHVRFKGIPTCLRDLLMGHPACVADLRVEDKPVTPIRQRFAMRGNDRDTGAFVQPGMRGSHACF